MIPDSSNFAASLLTTWSPKRIARLFKPPIWSVRKSSWTDYEVTSTFAEFEIMLDSPPLVSGSVAGIEINGDQILAVFEAARIGYSAEYYDFDKELLQERNWEAT